ncbi:RNA polymerase sigma factor [Desulfobotulus sp. H1]|uniref:RNA polymerase sigma factor n=1 Tax=Desulfobotulus pelophilus TaxID=2823377 RepID=A0ABT3N9K6_9BACT|nr:RNA polymerase sigma factor [Desulfobotulus pelophilus]
MKNPFKEISNSPEPDLLLVQSCLHGDGKALERLVLRHQAWIYNIAFKMVMDHEDAKDITQEILIRMVTHLGRYEPAKAAFRTWLYRVAVNHVLNMKKKRFEVRIHDFDTYVGIIEAIPDDRSHSHPETALLAEELKTGCMMGMILCLKRPERLVFLLGGVFGVRDRLGAELMEISPEAFRKKLSRGRQKVSRHMQGVCGHVDASNPCRCTHKVKLLSDLGMLDPEHLHFHRPGGVRVRDLMGERVLRFEKSYYDPFLARFRDQPFYDSPDMAFWLNDILQKDDFLHLFHLKAW